MIVGVTLAPAIDRTARVDRIAFDAILRPMEMRVLPGGKGVNAARAAARLGARVATTGICGGHAGHWLVEALDHEGLAPRFVTTEAETRTTYVTLDGSGRSMLVYEPSVAVDPGSLDRLIELLRAEPLASAEWLICSGSLPAGVSDDAYAQLTRVAQSSGKRCLIDAGGEPLAQALPERPDVVKISLDEARSASSATPHAGALELARRLAQRGARLAIVTDGPRGASASDGDRSWSVRVPRVKAVNPIGAGDAFNAGLVASLMAGESVENALSNGAGAAAASVLELGAGELDPDQAARLRSQVTVREVRHGTL